jgi:nicotinate-nucleotide pyrophosphorylase (carboxylating)
MQLKEFIKKALKEDIGDGDHTSLACIPSSAKSSAQLLVKENGIIAGVKVALEVFRQVDKTLKIKILLTDGTLVKKGDIVLTVSGKAQSILTAERLVLNIMQRMSGIATTTNKMNGLIKNTSCKILDTRKTTPNMRMLEKEAVRIGKGHNHRKGLYDMILIKDNHVDYAGGIKQAITAANDYLLQHKKKLKIEIEVRNLLELKEVLKIGKVNRIMLDNFNTNDLKKAIQLIPKKYETEASGGITEKNIRSYALTGVQYISCGALTHSIKSLDLSLKAIK